MGHGLALNHVIFNSPHKANFETVVMDRPKQYEGLTSPLYPKGVPGKYKLSAFEKKKPEMSNPTIVSHEGFFTDIPGFENLAEGNSAKMLGSLAIARQGTYLYWGYSADPDELTDGAKKVLLNSLHYMKGKRASITVPFVCKTRKVFWVFTILGKEKGYKRGVEEHFPGSLVDSAKQDYTPTFDGAKAWVDKYLPYVFSGKGEHHRHKRYKNLFEIDRDAMALKTPNRERASLEKWVALADGKKSEERALALSCLKRYVHPEIYPKDGDWKKWLATHGKRIAFIDSSGFWWQESPVVLEREQAIK